MRTYCCRVQLPRRYHYVSLNESLATSAADISLDIYPELERTRFHLLNSERKTRLFHCMSTRHAAEEPPSTKQHITAHRVKVGDTYHDVSRRI